MDLQESVTQNMKFLLIEVEKQVVRTGRFLADPSADAFKQVHASDDYVDNLKTFIQTKCFTLAARTDPSDKLTVGRLKALEVIAINLERISDFCESVFDQAGHLTDTKVLEQWDFKPFFTEIVAGVRHLATALDTGDVQEALAVCRAEQELDGLYARTLQRVLRELSSGAHAQTQVTILFISHYLERMGDSLLNGGEALISARLGERIKLDQLRTLEDSLGDIESDLEDVSMQAVGETKSGARIARLSAHPGNKSAIFKEGKTKKLVEERDSVERWQRVMPGIAPNIYSFHEEGDRSAILFEYLPGRTFEELLLKAPFSDLERALRRITETIAHVWQVTRTEAPSKPRFMRQLTSRIEDVRAVHPELLAAGGTIGGVQLQSYEESVALCAPLDELLSCSHSVLIHGDFNVDNVIFDDTDEVVRFIDLHRSRDMDYVQDVAVFLASNFRLQAFEAEIRRRINWVVRSFFDWSVRYALEVGDQTFALRLALGMARSFATSTRFVLDESLAREMFLRSRYMLETVAACRDAAPEQFRFPKEVLFD